MDHGPFIEIAGMANAEYLRRVVFPRCELRMAAAKDLGALRPAGTPSAIRVALAWVGNRMVAVGERLVLLGTTTAEPSA